MFKVGTPITTKVSDGRVKVVSSIKPSGYKTLAQASGTKGNRALEIANFGMGGMSGNNSVSMSTIGGSQRNNMDLILRGLLDDSQENLLNKYYRDIYYYDSVAGSAVDLQSSLPFSDFDIVGVEKAHLDVYNSSIARLNFKTMNRFISTNYLVYGAFIGTNVYNRQYKMFTDMLPYDIEDCDLQYNPFASMDPMVTVSPSEELQQFLTSEEPIIKELRSQLPRNLVDAMSQGDFILDPLTTLFLARRGMEGTKPISYYKRLLPIYLLEKTLLRGTLVEAGKRQRSLLHVQAGDENWEPTGEELQSLVSLFQQADLDPLGPIIATRNGITATEARQGGDFWKYTDIIDITNGLKLRALGISDTFLSGETSFATAEVALSVFIENQKAYRDYYTQVVFYNKLFPVIAAVNNFTNKHKENVGVMKSKDAGVSVKDPSNYAIPQVRWHKSLEPNNDRDTFEMLENLSELGFPVTLRMLAASAGLRVENILNELEEDVKLRKQFADYNEQVKKAGGQEEGGDFEGSSSRAYNGKISSLTAYSRLKLQNPYGRNFEGAGEVVGRTKTGKKKAIFNQKAAIKKENEVIAKASASVRDPNRRQFLKKKRST